MTGSLQKKSGKYYAVINIYQNGNRKQKWIDTGFAIKGNKMRAEKALREILVQYESSEIPIASDTDFADYISHWLDSVKNKIETDTYESYVETVKVHIDPYFRELNRSLESLTRADIQSYIDLKASSGRIKGKGGLSATTLRRHRVIIHMVFDLAIKENLIKYNPCELIELPKAKKYEAKFCDRDDINKLLTVSKNEEIYPIIFITVSLGLRRSEVLGLRWQSVDLNHDMITINNTVVKHTTTVEKERTKSKSSNRTLPLNASAKELLLQVNAKQDDNRKFFGNGYHESDYVFTRADGTLYNPDYITHTFSKILKKNGLEHVRFHDLRHACGGILMSEGCTLKDVQTYLGHANISVTADVYGHLDLSRKRMLSDKMSFEVGG